MTCWCRISPTKVEVSSPKALLASNARVPVCPTVPNPRLRIFLAALKSLSITQPHWQTWVLVDSVFFTIAPQTRAFLAGVLRIYRNRYFLKHLRKVFNPDTELIPRSIVNRLSQTMIFHHIFNPQIYAQLSSRLTELRTAQVSLHGLCAACLFWDGVFLKPVWLCLCSLNLLLFLMFDVDSASELFHLYVKTWDFQLLIRLNRCNILSALRLSQWCFLLCSVLSERSTSTQNWTYTPSARFTNLTRFIWLIW